MKLRIRINENDIYEVNTEINETQELSYGEFNRLVARLNVLANLMDGLQMKGNGKKLKIFEGRIGKRHYIPPTQEQTETRVKSTKLGRPKGITRFTREQVVEFTRRYYKIIKGDAEEGDSKEKLMTDTHKTEWIRTIQTIHRLRKVHNLSPQEAGLDAFPNQLKKGKSSFKKIQVIPTEEGLHFQAEEVEETQTPIEPHDNANTSMSNQEENGEYL